MRADVVTYVGAPTSVSRLSRAPRRAWRPVRRAGQPFARLSWGIALFGYLLQVPANRIGYAALSLGQLKIM